MAPMSAPSPRTRHARITGDARRKLAGQLAARYDNGESIRELCAATGYSIGRVRGLLITAGVTSISAWEASAAGGEALLRRRSRRPWAHGGSR